MVRTKVPKIQQLSTTRNYRDIDRFIKTLANVYRAIGDLKVQIDGDIQIDHKIGADPYYIIQVESQSQNQNRR